MCKTRIVLIPAYEPEKMLTDIAKEINRAGFKLIIVDDGSGEKYADIFHGAEKYALILKHKINRGKGCALKTGLSYINSRYEKNCVVVTMDSDGQHKVDDAVRLCNYAEKYPDTLVLGCRGLKGNIPIRSKFGNTVTRLVYHLSTGQRIYDTQTGLRAFSGNLIPKLLEISGERFEYEMNVLLKFARQKICIKEVMINTIYIDNNSGSHFDTVKDSYRVYKEIIKFSASSFIGFLTDYCLYSLMVILTAGISSSLSIMISNVGARIVSACVNYTINRRLVFKSSVSVAKSAVQYFLLAALILIGNTALLSIFVNILGINRFAAKLITEIVFFAVSWLIQHSIIFKKIK